MEKKNKKLLSKVEIIILAAFLIICAVLVTAELTSPQSAFAVWIRDNVWDLRESLVILRNQIPVIVSSLIYMMVIYAAGRILRLYFHKRMEHSDRSHTVYALLDGFVKYAIAIALIIMALRAVGVDTGALIASIGILTLVVGLGAQPLIADIIAGIFIIFENEYNVGEIVSINGFRGTVIEIGIRSTKLLDAAGNIKIINNNNVGDVVNLSRELSLAVVECDFPYDVPVEKIEAMLKKNMDHLKEEIPDIVDGPFYKGVSQYKDSNVTIKLVAQCKEENKFQVERDLLREYRQLLVENDIDIAYPTVVVNYQEQKQEIKATAREKRAADKFVDEQREESQDLESQPS